MLQRRVRRWIKQWKEEGFIEGRLSILVSMVRKRFGEQAATVTQEQLAGLRDLQRFDSLTDGLFDCQTAEQWLEWIARPQN